jgi:hypothetical protein
MLISSEDVMKTICIAIVLAGMLLAMFAPPAHAQGSGFTIPLTIADSGFLVDTLYFGRNVLATYCIDTALGEAELAPVPLAGIGDVRFVNADGSVGCLGEGVKRNLYPKYALLSDTFHIALQPAAGQTLFHLSWPPYLGHYFFEARLVDQGGGILVTVNMQMDTVAVVPTAVRRLDIITQSVIDLAVRESKLLPADFELYQNYPNPFNPITVVRYAVRQSSLIEVTVIDLLGREVAGIVFEGLPPGTYHSTWNGRDMNGLPASSGVYLLRMSARSMAGGSVDGPRLFSSVKKMVLMK